MHHQYWTLTGTCLGYLSFATNHGGPVVMVTLGQSVDMFQQVIDGIDVGVKSKALHVGMGCS